MPIVLELSLTDFVALVVGLVAFGALLSAALIQSGSRRAQVVELHRLIALTRSEARAAVIRYLAEREPPESERPTVDLKPGRELPLEKRYTQVFTSRRHRTTDPSDLRGSVETGATAQGEIGVRAEDAEQPL